MNGLTYEQYVEVLEMVLELGHKNAENIPERIVNTSIDNISKAYAEAYKKLYIELLDSMNDTFGIGANPTQAEMMSVIAQIESRLDMLNSELSNQMKTEIQKNYIMGNALHVVIAEQITDMSRLQEFIPFSLINTAKAEQLIADTMDDLLFITENTKHSVKRVIRETFNKHLTLAGIEGTSASELKQTIRKELTKQGLSQTIQDKAFIGVVDKSGRKWQLKTYVDMAVKTKMEQAYHNGLKDDALKSGHDLARIMAKGATDPCKYFENLIISMTGQTEGFLTYDQLKATGLIFHPNCRHNCVPLGRWEIIPEHYKKKHEKQLPKAKAFLKRISKNKRKK